MLNADKVILGKNCEYSTDSYETQLNNNIIVCGASGCGKTRSVSEARLLETMNSSIVTTMSKRRLAETYAPVFEKRGYNVLTMDFAEPERSTVCFDPLQYIHSYPDITEFANAVVCADDRKNNANVDPYWDQVACSLLSAEIAYVMMTKPYASFADVLDFHSGLKLDISSSMAKTNYDDKFKELEDKDPSCFAVSCWRSFSSTTDRVAGIVYSTLNTTMDKLFTPAIRSLMRNVNSIAIESIGRMKTALFIITSPVETSQHIFVNLFYSQLFKDLFKYAESRRDGMLPIPVHVLCDDFAVGSAINKFPEYISIFREKQISVTMLLQSESQLESMYGKDDAVTIINNSDTYLYMGGTDLTTARSISTRLDVPLSEVLYMPIGKEIVFRRGQLPVITQRYDIRENDKYKELMGEDKGK